MVKVTLNIDGMQCGMCESHVNDVVRRTINPKKVTSAHVKGQTVILCDDEPNEAALTQAIAEQGYRVLGIKVEPYNKQGFFEKIFGKKK